MRPAVFSLVKNNGSISQKEIDLYREAEAIVDAAIACESIQGPVSDDEREQLILAVKNNPLLTGFLFGKSSEILH